VVDDSRTARFMVKNLLNKRNFNVLEAKDGIEALAVLQDKDTNIKLIITDYNMPNMDGFELVSKVRDIYNKEQMGIIAISSDSNSDVTVKFLKNGANDFLIKPFHELEFFCRVEQVVENLINISAINELANRDFLTKMYNRRYFFNKLTKNYTVIKKSSEPTCIAILDIDKFKDINDTYGHNVGDLIIKKLSSMLIENFENNRSIPARLGGEEFCILFYRSSLNKVFLSMEAFRRAIENQKIEINDNQTLKFTISIGISSNIGDTYDEFIGNADKLLYQAKENGRNRVEIDRELTIKEH
jgi:diguanylate cyclase (GGDEF)-like protein